VASTEAQRRHYQENKAIYKARAKKRNVEQRVRLRILVNDLKSVSCLDCNGDFPPCAMDFHHVRGKDSSIPKLVKQAVSEKRLLAEIEKCVVLCANCHRIRHCPPGGMEDTPDSKPGA
jgi:hypothetical protein